MNISQVFQSIPLITKIAGPLIGAITTIKSIKDLIYKRKSMSKVDFKFEGSKLSIAVDPNEDGQSVLKVEVDLAEIPDEVLSLISAKKAEKSKA